LTVQYISELKVLSRPTCEIKYGRLTQVHNKLTNSMDKLEIQNLHKFNDKIEHFDCVLFY
jgi:hypothetical protein